MKKFAVSQNDMLMAFRRYIISLYRKEKNLDIYFLRQKKVRLAFYILSF